MSCAPAAKRWLCGCVFGVGVGGGYYTRPYKLSCKWLQTAAVFLQRSGSSIHLFHSVVSARSFFPPTKGRCVFNRDIWDLQALSRAQKLHEALAPAAKWSTRAAAYKLLLVTPVSWPNRQNGIDALVAGVHVSETADNRPPRYSQAFLAEN